MGIRRSAWTIGLLVALSGCGDDAPEPTPRSSATSKPVTETSERRREPKVKTPTVSVETLLAQWTQAGVTDDPETSRQELNAQLVSLGKPAARLLIEIAIDDAHDDQTAAWRLLREFGSVAIEPLCDRLEACTTAEAFRLVTSLAALGPYWSDSPSCERVCRALLTRVEAYGASSDDVGYTSLDTAVQAVQALGTFGGAHGDFVADRVAKVWKRVGQDEKLGWKSELGSAAIRSLARLRTKASSAAPLVIEVLQSSTELPDEVRAKAFEVLHAIGPAAPESLSNLRELLRSGSDQQRAETLYVLRAWGTAAQAAEADVLDVLRGNDPALRIRAAIVLANFPSAQREHLRPVLTELLSESYFDGTPEPMEALHVLLRAPQVAQCTLEQFDALDPTQFYRLLTALRMTSSPLLTTFIERAARHADVHARRGAILAWKQSNKGEAPPPAVRALLKDPEWSLRLELARYLIEREGPVDPGAMDTAIEATQAADTNVRVKGLWLLSYGGPRVGPSALAHLGDANALVRRAAVDGLTSTAQQPETRRRIVAMLSDENIYVRMTAASVLDKQPGSLAPVPDGTAERLAEALLVRGGFIAPVTRILLACPGGQAAFDRTIRSVLNADASSSRRRSALDALFAAGPDAAGLREDLERLRERATWSNGNRRHTERLDDLLASLTEDLEAWALSTPIDKPQTCARALVQRGSDGYWALLLLAGRGAHLRKFLPENDVATWSSTFSRVKTSASDPQRLLRERGAARLGRSLPDPAAASLLGFLVKRADFDTRMLALQALAAVAQRAPESIDVEGLRGCLGALDVQRATFNVIEAMGDRGRPLLPTLQELQSSGGGFERVRAATLAWRLTGRVDDAATVVRRAIDQSQPTRSYASEDENESFGSGHLEDRNALPWADVAAVLLAAKPSRDDVQRVLRIVPPGNPEFLLPVLARFGADAAPAVPLLRQELATLETTNWHMGREFSDYAEVAIEVLTAIGPAARDALPDLRRWVALSGDPKGIGKKAIEAIDVR